MNGLNEVKIIIKEGLHHTILTKKQPRLILWGSCFHVTEMGETMLNSLLP